MSSEERALARPSTTTYSAKLGRDLDTALAEVKLSEKYDVLMEFKQWAKQDPNAVRELLQQKPDAAHALLKLFIEFKMCVTPPDMSRASIADGEEEDEDVLESNKEQLKAVLALSEEEISMLDPQQQAQVRLIRASIRM